ncbi:hypothetical protein QOZ80_1BG0050880 [Eleusine coracana subsp. coracana]|nr:hypothetical protein QOZ80_1BG0050880 [Eleusine coracana subsp. coracana]
MADGGGNSVQKETLTALFFEPRSETYPGESEDLQYLGMLLYQPEQPHDIIKICGHKDDGTGSTTESLDEDANAEVAPRELFADITEVDQRVIMLPSMLTSADYVYRNAKVPEGNHTIMVPVPMVPNMPGEPEEEGHEESLEASLREGRWEGALVHLEHMVRNGQATNGAVQNNEAPNDIFRAHPELVLRLRGQILFDMVQQGHIGLAQAYHQGQIAIFYPNDSTGSPFVDKSIMKSIRKLLSDGLPAGGDHAIFTGEKNRKCIEDYLKIYFPLYRPKIRAGGSRVWEFGEKIDGKIRCSLCHKEVRGSNLWKLRAHLLGQDAGRQGKCAAVNLYISGRLQQILAEEGFSSDGTLNRYEVVAVHPPETSTSSTPPDTSTFSAPRPPLHAGNPTSSTPPLPPPPPDDDDEGGPALPADGGDATG